MSSKQFEDSTAMFCEGKVNLKQVVSMDIFACSTLLELCKVEGHTN